jgi:dihydrofolate reductase
MTSRRKLVLLEHISLDGFLAGPNGEMDWIRVGDEVWDYVDPLTAAADTAVFGRVTYQMMASYWPAAADGQAATKHDIDHARWVNGARKLVASRTLAAAPWGKWDNVTLVRDDFAAEIRARKQQPGKDMLLIGSASLARSLIGEGLIDEYRITVNPVVLGGGAPLFPGGVMAPLDLCLVEARTFASGVVALHYRAGGQA